jgi:hypothetical protein
MDGRIRKYLPCLLLATAFQGCNCAHNRQTVYPNSSGGPVRVETFDGVTVKAPFVDVRVPNKSTPQASSVDVPMLDD